MRNIPTCITMMVALLLLIVIPSCKREDSRDSATQTSAAATQPQGPMAAQPPTVDSAGAIAPSAPQPTLVPLTINGTAYVRIKHYFARRGNSALVPSSTGIMLKSFSPAFQLSGEDDSDKVGYELRGMTQTKDDGTIAFEFGDKVTLLQTNDGPPKSWLVSSGSSQAWIPAYILTPNKAEVELLKNANIIPDSITFVYGGDLSVWGIDTYIVRLNPVELEPIGKKVAVYTMGGLHLPSDEDCSTSLGYEGNAVVFDEDAAKAMSKPLLSFKVLPNCIYYCDSASEKPSFECIDLLTLKSSK